MKKTTLFLLILGLAAVLQPAIAGGNQSAGETTIHFFSGRVETVEWTNQIIAEFEALNPSIRVEHEFQQDASNAIRVKLAAGAFPDITTVVNQELIDQGVYADLSELEYWERILPSIRALSTDLKSGNQYKIATNITVGGLFYNKQIFESLGLEDAQTWDEFVANLEAIKEAYPEVVPLFLGGRDSWTLGHLIEFWAHGIVKQEYGIPGSRIAFLENDSEKLAWDAPGGVMEKFAAALLELKDKGLINSDAVTATYDNQKEAFANGQAAIINQGMWVVGDIIGLNPEMESNIGFGPFPPVVSGFKPMVLSAEDSVYAIAQDSEHREEILLFLDYLFSPAVQASYSSARGIPSAFTDVNADWGPIKDDVRRVVDQYVNINFSTEAPSGLSVDDTGRLIQELLLGRYSGPAEFAQKYQELWDEAY